MSDTIDNETGEILADDDAPASADEAFGSDAEIVAKLSVATMGINPAIVKLTGQRTPIGAAWGRATGTKVSVDSKGEVMADKSGKPLVGLVGQFRGVNLQSGAEYMSSTLYLHSAFQRLIEDELAKQEGRAKRGSGNFRGVEFGFRIDAVPAANPAGYSYVYVSMMPATKADPLAHLTDRAHALLESDTKPALPAPEAAKVIEGEAVGKSRR